MQEKEHTVYVYRMIKLFNKEVRTLFNQLDTQMYTLSVPRFTPSDYPFDMSYSFRTIMNNNKHAQYTINTFIH
jgi:hypothetical protein